MNVYAERERDWRCGPLVYQVLVDRFAPSARLEEKRALYAAPRRLRGWDEEPKKGRYLAEHRVWSHELEFWGGDLASARDRLDALQALGVDVVYLNPIHDAFTNHKYDARDYAEVAPELGTRADVAALAADLHRRGMRLVLDGVFNHVGWRCPWFARAQAGEAPWRDWFVLGPEYPDGYRCWANARNLPELRLEAPDLRAALWGDPQSVVQRTLREGVDGWRLDVAYDLGPEFLAELTAAAHRAKPDALTVGEVYNVPTRWLGPLDAVMNMSARELILRLVRGQLAPALCARHLERLVGDAPFEGLLRSWLVLDNHDTARLATQLPEAWQRALAQTLQFTLPGAPQLYYGVEAGLEGGVEPASRGPMRWERAVAGNPEFDRVRALSALRRARRGLRVGDYLPLDAEACLAFARQTERAQDTAIVVVNPGAREVRETLWLRDSWLMHTSTLRCALSGAQGRVIAGVLELAVPAHSARVLFPERPAGPGYSATKRVP
ncbi:MAG: alpha-amylase family glycosyl hydrolase [Planctomycetota bacterium]